VIRCRPHWQASSKFQVQVGSAGGGQIALGRAGAQVTDTQPAKGSGSGSLSLAVLQASAPGPAREAPTAGYGNRIASRASGSRMAAALCVGGLGTYIRTSRFWNDGEQYGQRSKRAKVFHDMALPFKHLELEPDVEHWILRWKLKKVGSWIKTWIQYVGKLCARAAKRAARSAGKLPRLRVFHKAERDTEPWWGASLMLQCRLPNHLTSYHTVRTTRLFEQRDLVAKSRVFKAKRPPQQNNPDLNLQPVD
jgi:hypothetical protein